MAVNINVPSQVKTYANLAAFPATGALKTIYIAEDTNKTYRWTGSVYTEISASAAMTWGAIGGTLSNQTDLQNALDAKVPTSRTLTINGVTQDLSANRTFTISTGITIGSTAIASGSVGRILFEGAGNVVQESSSLFWDATNNRLGIGTSTPVRTLDVQSAQPVVRVLSTTNTNASAVQLSNFAGDFWIGRENSAGNTFGMAAPAYAGVINARGDYPLYIGRNDFNNITISTNNNVLINTTTDAGFRLDVNGTARVSGNFTLRNVTDELLFANATVKIRRVSDKLSLEGFSGFDFIDTNTAFTRMQIRSTGNVLINTTTDAGFRLDVNGTARVQDRLTLGTSVANGQIQCGLTTLEFRGAQVTNVFTFRQINSGAFNSSALDQSLVNLAINQAESTNNPNRGSVISISGTINNTGANSYVYRGIYYNPTVTSLTNTQHYAFHSTAGRIRFENLPTSSAGLLAGDIWNDAGTLKIV